MPTPFFCFLEEFFLIFILANFLECRKPSEEAKSAGDGLFLFCQTRKNPADPGLLAISDLENSA